MLYRKMFRNGLPAKKVANYEAGNDGTKKDELETPSKFIVQKELTKI